MPHESHTGPPELRSLVLRDCGWFTDSLGSNRSSGRYPRRIIGGRAGECHRVICGYQRPVVDRSRQQVLLLRFEGRSVASQVTNLRSRQVPEGRHPVEVPVVRSASSAPEPRVLGYLLGGSVRGPPPPQQKESHLPTSISFEVVPQSQRIPYLHRGMAGRTGQRFEHQGFLVEEGCSVRSSELPTSSLGSQSRPARRASSGSRGARR